MNLVQVVMGVWAYATANLANLILSLNLLFAFLIGVFTLVPGDQPEKSLQKIADFVSKYSKK